MIKNWGLAKRWCWIALGSLFRFHLQPVLVFLCLANWTLRIMEPHSHFIFSQRQSFIFCLSGCLYCFHISDFFSLLSSLYFFLCCAAHLLLNSVLSFRKSLRIVSASKEVIRKYHFACMYSISRCLIVWTGLIFYSSNPSWTGTSDRHGKSRWRRQSRRRLGRIFFVCVSPFFLAVCFSCFPSYFSAQRRAVGKKNTNPQVK